MTDSLENNSPAGPGDDGAAPSPENHFDERPQNQAGQDFKALNIAALWVSLAAVVLAGVAVYLRIPGSSSFAYGLIWGCLVSVLNIQIIGRAIWSLFQQQVGLAIMGLSLSLAIMLGAAAWLVLAHPEWGLGFGCGLGLPAAAGVAFAYHVYKRTLP